MLGAMNRTRYTARVYVAAATDAMARNKVVQHESVWAASSITPEPTAKADALRSRAATRSTAAGSTGQLPLPSADEVPAAPSPTVYTIPRSREVGQAWATSILTTAWATLVAFSIMWAAWPSLLLVNGPGTCLPVCIAAHTFRCVCTANIVSTLATLCLAPSAHRSHLQSTWSCARTVADKESRAPRICP